jgi:hypothetical protein
MHRTNALNRHLNALFMVDLSIGAAAFKTNPVNHLQLFLAEVSGCAAAFKFRNYAFRLEFEYVFPAIIFLDLKDQ